MYEKSKFRLAIIFALALSMLLSGCFLNDNVRTDQQGLIIDGGRIKSCVGPGVYSDMGWFTDLVEVGMGTLTFGVDDPEVATSDNQLVSVAITVQAKRSGNCDDLKNLVTSWPALVEDPVLSDTVSRTAREAIKNGVRSFTLNQLLDDRNSLSLRITEALQEDANKYGATIINVTIENIGIDPDYAAQLNQKALYRVQTEAELERQQLISQQAANDRLEEQQRVTVLEERIKAEKAETDVQVEIARRQGEKVAAQYQVYLDNEAAYDLERLRLLQGIIGENWVFTNPDIDPTLFFTIPQEGVLQPVPVPSTQETGE